VRIGFFERDHLRVHMDFMPSVPTIFLPASAYLLGSIPFGLLLARMRGVDVRSVGSGNIGATNVTRALGKGFGLLTFCADLSKGFVPVLVCRAVLPAGLETQTILALTGFGAVLGHCFPVFLGFRGGKGIATASGVFLGICPLALARPLSCLLSPSGLPGSSPWVPSSPPSPFLWPFIFYARAAAVLSRS